MLGVGETVMNKTDTVLTLLEINILGEDKSIKKLTM